MHGNCSESKETAYGLEDQVLFPEDVRIISSVHSRQSNSSIYHQDLVLGGKVVEA